MVLTKVLKCKIHRATITDANVEYVGSITLDQDLMEATGLVEFEAVHVWNITQGTRLMTYAIPGPRGTGSVCLNGAAARLNARGDIVIIAAFVDVDERALQDHSPRMVFVDSSNRIVSTETGTRA